MVEAIIEFCMNSPKLVSRISSNLLVNLRRYYMDFDRRVIQFYPEYAVYDSGLFYTLKPNSEFVYYGREFRNKFVVNSLGVRDDEASLKSPGGIVLGDSFAMGWGVDQDASFPEILEKELDYKVLNLSVSSYGTAREITLLNRAAERGVDVTHARFILIQYCDNDTPENIDFYLKSNQFVAGGREVYDRARAWQTNLPYFPGKYLLHLMLPTSFVLKFYPPDPYKVDSQDGKEQTADTYSADAFLNVLAHAPKIDLSAAQLYLIAIEDRNGKTEPFLSEVESKLGDSKYPAYLRQMKIIDVTKDLKEDDFYTYDSHINSFGHDVVARAILRNIKTGGK